MSRGWEISIENTLKEQAGEIEKVKGVLENLSDRLTVLDGLIVDLQNVKSVVSELAIGAAEKVSPIKVPPRPKILREILPEDPPPTDAAA